MYSKVLIAYDGTQHSDAALRQGSDIARLCKAELHLVGIFATKGYMLAAPGMGGGFVDIWALQQHDLEVALKAAQKNVAEQGMQATTSLRTGNPAQEIAACANELGADLVVLGHSDKGVLGRWFEGSVSEGLVRDLPCSLLIATE